MPTLSILSRQEICDLLDEYGIKHGPVVDTTRALYESKLREAMARGKKPKPSSDKTYYREEEDEVTYVYRTPVSATRSDVLLDRGTYMRTRPEPNEREYEHEKSYSNYSKSRPEPRGRGYADEPNMYDTPPSYRNVSYTKPAPVTAPQAAKSSRLIPIWLQILLFLIAAAFLYFVFSDMETTEEAPFKNIE